MNQLKRFSIISIVVFFFMAVNVSCLRGNGVASGAKIGEVQSHQKGSTQNEDIENHFTFLEKTGDELAEKLVDGIVSALQKNSTASFVEGGVSFDFKAEAKAQAKTILKEIVRAGLGPFEEVVAKSVKPPTIPSSMYKALKPAITEVFNKVERAVKVEIPDDIWDVEGDDDSSFKRRESESFDDDDLDF